MAKSITQEFVKGLWDEIPPFRLVLGLCPTLAVTKSVENGLGMGVAVIFVLVCSNVLVSLLRKIITSQVRIACYHSNICYCCRTSYAGIYIFAFFKARNIHPSHCR
jgi:Na+-translocating ferredoxin:NAD+ oxidoreductase RnfE subunit